MDWMSKYVDYGLGAVKKAKKTQTMEYDFKTGLGKQCSPY